MPWLITPAQLDNFRKKQKNVVILDASWHLPEEGRNSQQEFSQEHIIGAQLFDISLFNDPTRPQENYVLLDKNSISTKLSTLGIRNDAKIIFYDNSKLHTSCRALWMLKLFGHDPSQLYILDGGLTAWKKYGGKIATGQAIPSPKTYQAELRHELFFDLNQMKENERHPQWQIIDARHPIRFIGGPEPRPGLRRGHIPNSFCLPYFSLFDKDNYFISLEKFRSQLSDIGITTTAPIVTTCGSAITAPIINFMLDLLNFNQHSVYNGSWLEWGKASLYPGEISLEERPVMTFLS